MARAEEKRIKQVRVMYRDTQQEISVHNSDISTTRVGFKYIFLGPFKTFGEKVIRDIKFIL